MSINRVIRTVVILLAALLTTLSADAAGLDLPALALAEPGEAGEAQPAARVRADEFAQGQWVFTSYPAVAPNDEDHGEVYMLKFGVGYHFVDNLSINLEPFAAWADPTDGPGEAGGGGLDLLLRWHFFRGDGWSLYADAGAGLIYLDTEFRNSSRWAFTPQAGMGVTLRLTDRLHLMGGARWLHISNAGATDFNPGFDSGMYYIGVMVPF